MKIVVIIFMIVSSLMALSTLSCVVVDVVVEKSKKKEAPKEEKKEVSMAVVTPVVEEVTEVMPEIVEHIDAEEADEMISDALAMKTAGYESGAGRGQQAIINIGVLDENFEANAVITLALLKEKGLISKKAGRMKVLAYGVLNKPLTIKAESYSIQAIKMIALTGGTVVILKN